MITVQWLKKINDLKSQNIPSLLQNNDQNK